MKKIIGAIVGIVVAGGVLWVTRPSVFDTGNPLVTDGSDINLLQGLDTADLSQGWVHHEFLTVAPTDYRMVEDNGTPALRCTTSDSASILARDTDIPVDTLPILSWQWKVTQPIESDVDEGTEAGDDQPLRFFITFSNQDAETKSMEIIWSNKKYAPGDYKIIGNFHHYVANGLDENVGTWHPQQVDLRQLYKDIGGTGAPTLQVLGFFCDSDNTGTKSDGMFKDVVLSGAT